MPKFMDYLRQFGGLRWPGSSETPVEQAIINTPDTSVGAFRAYEAANPPTPTMPTVSPPVRSARPGGTLPAFTMFMNSIAGQGLSTDEIIARAQAQGIPASQVLTELTKPQYRPDPAFPGTDPRMRVENNFNIPPPGTPGLPMVMHSQGSPIPDTSVGAFRAYEAANPPAPAPIPNEMPYPGTDPRASLAPVMPDMPRMNRSHVAGQYVGSEGPIGGTVEGTFPDMVSGLPQPSEVRMGGSVNYKHPTSAADEMAVILGNLQRPSPSPMQAMLADRTQRREIMSAPVDIRRSDVRLDAPYRPSFRRR